MRSLGLFLAVSPLVSFTTAIKLPYAAAAAETAVELKFRKGGGCPPVWKQVKSELNGLFMTGNQCNSLARSAIRAILHDCGDISQKLTGGCDGSLFLGVTPDVELNRPENRGFRPIAGLITGLSVKYGTSVADMIVFAGNAAIALCPGGPKVKTFVGRKGSTKSAPRGRLPDVFDSASHLVALFAKKGLSAEDLAALLGAHSTSTQKFVDPTQFNKSQDSTPGQWDVSYYRQTYNYATTGRKPDNVFVLPSDANLATYGDVGKKFQEFIGNQGKWTSSFVRGMGKMCLFGNEKKQMLDCTSALG